MDKKKCIILIPYYKNELKYFEKASLERVLLVLGKWDIAFVSPKNLEIINCYSHIQTFRFHDNYFKNIDGYNQLLLSDSFYSSFTNYEYLLIYQLDSWVFSDKLNIWCDLSFDYYGAPWEKKEWGDRYFNLFGLLKNNVGNGGFSLRRVDKFYDMARKIRHIRKLIKFGEDIFWSNYGTFINSSFSKLDLILAKDFAFESNPSKLFSENGGILPFGCHAFEKYEINFWASHIDCIKYNVDN